MHEANDVFGNDAGAIAIAGERDVEGDVEMDGFRVGTELSGDFQEGLAVFSAEVGGIDQGEGHLELEALAKKVAEGAEDGGVNLLVGLVTGEQEACGIGTERSGGVALGPGAFARAGNAD